MAHILIVDDENNIRKMVRMALEQRGHVVEEASDGREGLLKYGTGEAWDLVLLDHRMPGMDGLAVLREIRQRRPDTAVIMITAVGTIDLAVDAMKAGATDFLRKPFTLGALRGAVQAAVAPEPRGDANTHEQTVFCFATLNGFQIETRSGPGEHSGGKVVFHMQVRAPSGAVRPCVVVLAGYVMELVKALTDREEMPGGDRFWQGLCEEALANHLWQHARIPDGGVLMIEDLTAPLKRWTEEVLQGGA